MSYQWAHAPLNKNLQILGLKNVLFEFAQRVTMNYAGNKSYAIPFFLSENIFSFCLNRAKKLFMYQN